MAEWRKDFLTGDWVSLAEARSKRPLYYDKQLGGEAFACPFCRGNEWMTPPSSFESGDGRVRVIPNLYPMADALSAGGYGYHDVIIDTDLHDEALHMFSTAQIAEVFLAARERMRFLERDERIKYIQIFKNYGESGGASIAHSHWQIAAVPFVPSRQRVIYENAHRYYLRKSVSYIADEIENCADRLIYENSEICVFTPYAAKYSYETYIAPKKQIANFRGFSDEGLYELADAVKKSVGALHVIYPGFSYNVCFQNCFVNCDENEYEDMDKCMHFHMNIIPRTGYMAGFEFSTSSYINSVRPENAAENLRRAMKNIE